MTHNVGHFDAVSRRVVGVWAVLGGLASLNGFFWSMGFITWIVLAFMVATGFFYLMAGMRGGTAIFGFLLIVVSLLDGWLALRHEGTWALILGLVVGAVGFTTAQMGWCPINQLLRKDTHDADAEWLHPRPAH
jgi:Inner membrane protein YgaP-like, transmembrane domain